MTLVTPPASGTNRRGGGTIGARALGLCLGLAALLSGCAGSETPGDAGAAVREDHALDLSRQEKVDADRATRRLDAGARARAAAGRDIDAANVREARRVGDSTPADPAEAADRP